MIVSEQLLRQIEDLEIEQEIQNRASKRLSKISNEAKRLETLLQYIDNYRLKKTGQSNTRYVPNRAQLSETERLEAELNSIDVIPSEFQSATPQTQSATDIPDIAFDEELFEISEAERNELPPPSASPKAPNLTADSSDADEVIVNAERFDISPEELHELQALPDTSAENIPDLSEALLNEQLASTHEAVPIAPEVAPEESDGLDSVEQALDASDELDSIDVIDSDMRARVERELDEEIYAGADYYERRYLDEIKELADELGIRKQVIEQRVQKQAAPIKTTTLTAKQARQPQKQAAGFVICLAFNKKRPVEWTEEGSGGWRELGFGKCYPELIQAKACLKTLQQRWPEYPLKIVKRN